MFSLDLFNLLNVYKHVNLSSTIHIEHNYTPT